MAAELICAGHYKDVWETIFLFVAKNIHLANPKLVVYVEKRYQIFRNIMNQGFYTSELDLRNNKVIRTLFAEVIATISLSEKKQSFETIKIDKTEEFDITQLSERLIAPSIKYIENIFRKDDPKELFIAFNELAYCVSQEKQNMAIACYWIEWLIEYDNICKNKKNPCVCENRNQYEVDKKYKTDFIWIVWEILENALVKKENPFLMKIFSSIVSIFCVKYSGNATCKKRKYLLYFAVSLITEHVPTNVEIVTKKEVVSVVVEKIDQIYKQIKKNEESPNTDYLYSNIEKMSNLQSSISKMEAMNSLDVFHTT
jgi:hypothetical protein